LLGQARGLSYDKAGDGRDACPTLRMKAPAQIDVESLGILDKALRRLDAGFAHLPPLRLSGEETQSLERVLLETAEKLQDNYPYFHPLYAGQMLKPPDPVARLAYALTLWLNPNNHALDGGRASSAMEKAAVAELARMMGWKTHLGHLCSGGTMANLEALWIAGQLAPDKTIVASQQAHYTHERLSGVLKLKFQTVPCNRFGRLEIAALKKVLKTGKVGTAVATIGTTATGSVDPLAELLDLRARYGFRVHADAAYGGYFALAENLGAETRRNLKRLGDVDSAVIDPHKHGLQPYGCGCVLFRDPAVGRFYRHHSPYTYFTSNELHLGEISLECSRPGAAAVALWATQKLLPLAKRGKFGRRLEQCHAAAAALYAKLKADRRWVTAFPPELDILVWTPRAERVSQASELSRRIFAEAARDDLHLALATLPVDFFDLRRVRMARDAEEVVCLRSVLMKPEHAAWVDEIWRILNHARAKCAP
jgi:tyrosine decarboxylase / aspartate 1-decarboxylase